MKTPWSNLLQYGVGTAAMIVIIIGGLIMLAVVGMAVLVTKFLVFIR